MRIALPTRLSVAALAVWATPYLAGSENLAPSRIEQYLEALRQQAGIPGLSAAIVQDGTLAWERGFGDADVERAVSARPDTPYPIAGLTTMLSAVEALQCVERGRLTLSTLIGDVFAQFTDPGATVREVLSYTNGGRFVLDPARYDGVAAAVKTCSGSTLRRNIDDEIFDRLGMRDSVPGQDFSSWSPGTVAQFPSSTIDRYAAIMARIAKPYRTGRGKPIPNTMPQTGLSGASGVVSTVRDLARFQGALEGGVLIDRATLQTAWTAPPLGDGRPSPHALGWFVQRYEGQTVVWQFGVVPEAYSSLVITLPQRGVTMILLANSDGLVEPFQLANGDISPSPFARLFIRLFS